MSTCGIDINSTKLVPWTIDSSILETNITKCMFENVEFAGSFHMIQKSNCSEKECVPEVVSDIHVINKGNASSVKTTDGYCNFHTHPFSCYSQEKTVWGWPSGEDMRECVCFNMKNNFFHLIMTMEGVYMVQVNPNFTKLMIDNEYMEKKLKDYKIGIPVSKARGIIVSMIELNFKATHGHRTIEYNQIHKSNFVTAGLSSTDTGICMPQDWIEFTNKFTLGGLSSGKNICSRLLPCGGVPEYNEESTGVMDIQSYIDIYKSEIYNLSQGAMITEIDNPKYKYVYSNLSKIVGLFNETPNILMYNSEKWNPGQWFHAKIFYNTFLIKGIYQSLEALLSICDKSRLETELHSFWEHCNRNKNGIKFSTISINFKPLTNNCKLNHGKDLHSWSSGMLKKKKYINKKKTIK